MANILSTGGEGDRYKGSIAENGTYGVVGVLWVYSGRNVDVYVMEVALV